MNRMGSRRLGEITVAADVATGITHSFHREHLFAACLFARRARRLEERGVTGVGPEGMARHRAYVTGAIFSSVAFLDCSINELYLESRRAGRNGTSLQPTRAHTLLAKLWPSVEFSPMMLRYKMALKATDAERFDELRAPYRDVETLIGLRDALVHYQPERHHERRRHHRLQRRLRGKFALNTLLPMRALWFPDLCLGSGCAQWALRTAQAFSDEVCHRISIPSRGQAACDPRPRLLLNSERAPASAAVRRTTVRRRSSPRRRSGIAVTR
jgi:hypothetical protein